MITSLIICSVSAIFFALLVYGKRSELNGGRQLIRIGSESLDNRLHSYYERQREFIHSVDSKYVYEKLHLVAEKVEQWGLIMLDGLVNKFGRAKDMVSGKDLPKNRGAVSFFLKHIESHKKSMQKNMKNSAHQSAPQEESPDELNMKDIDKAALQIKMDQVTEIFDNQDRVGRV